MTLSQKIEGILFATGESMTAQKIALLLQCTKKEALEAIEGLKKDIAHRGIVLIENQEEYILGTHPDLTSILEEIKKEEVSRELSKASLETLAIVLYRNGVTRSEIDYVRGVNSGFILRNLLIRGLIEKSIDSTNSRRTVYYPSTELFTYLGITNRSELPSYEEFSAIFKEQDQKMNAVE